MSKFITAIDSIGKRVYISIEVIKIVTFEDAAEAELHDDIARIFMGSTIVTLHLTTAEKAQLLTVLDKNVLVVGEPPAILSAGVETGLVDDLEPLDETEQAALNDINEAIASDELSPGLEETGLADELSIDEQVAASGIVDLGDEIIDLNDPETPAATPDSELPAE